MLLFVAQTSIVLVRMLRIFLKCGFLIVLLMAFVLQKPETLFLGFILCVVYVMCHKKNLRAKWSEFLVVAIVVLLCGVSAFSFNHGLSPMFYMASTLAAFYAAKQFNNAPIHEIFYALEIVFWLAIVAIGWALLYYWDFPEPLGEVVPGSSTNGIPSYLIVLQIAVSLAVYLKNGKLPIISPLFTLAVAIFGLGRGSMVVAGIILISSVVINFSLAQMPRVTRFVVMMLTLWAMLIALVILVSYFDLGLIYDNLIGQSKFREGLLDPYRGAIFQEYLSKLDFVSLLFGADYSGTVIDTQYLGNPHISYVRTHAYYGLFGVLFVVCSPFLILLSNKQLHHKFIFLLFVLFALARALSEPLLFPTLLDFFYFSYFFMFFKNAPSAMLKYGH